MIRFVVPGEPMPKERARGGQGRFYTPKETVDAEKTVRDYAQLKRISAQAYVAGPNGENVCTRFPAIGNFWLGATFYLGTKRSKHGKILYRDADLDNLVKLVQDAIKGVFWIDDKQVRGYLPGTNKVLGYQYPQTIVVIAREDELSREQLANWGELPREVGGG